MTKTAPLSRRAFLEQTTLAALGVATAKAPAADTPGTAARRWRVTCRDVHLKATGQPDCWTAARALAVDGLELGVNEEMACPSLFHPDRKYTLASAEGLQRLQEDLQANRLSISALCLNNRLDERLEQEIAWMSKAVAAAKALDVHALRIDVVPRAIARDQFLPFAIKACQQLVAQTAGTQVRLGIENHGSTTNDPAFLQQLFDGVGSAQLGLTLDACNFYWYGHPLNELYGIYERFAGRVFHTHCKNIRYPEDKRNQRRPAGWEYDRYACPLGEGDLDYHRVAELLQRARYPGDLCLENECLGHFPKDQHAALLARETAFLRSL
jgi:sugar phosphate isomerase/epimerase